MTKPSVKVLVKRYALLTELNRLGPRTPSVSVTVTYGNGHLFLRALGRAASTQAEIAGGAPLTSNYTPEPVAVNSLQLWNGINGLRGTELVFRFYGGRSSLRVEGAEDSYIIVPRVRGAAKGALK